MKHDQYVFGFLRTHGVAAARKRFSERVLQRVAVANDLRLPLLVERVLTVPPRDIVGLVAEALRDQEERQRETALRRRKAKAAHEKVVARERVELEVGQQLRIDAQSKWNACRQQQHITAMSAQSTYHDDTTDQPFIAKWLRASTTSLTDFIEMFDRPRLAVTPNPVRSSSPRTDMIRQRARIRQEAF